MKTKVITSFDMGYKSLADITVPRMKAWSTRHGYEFSYRVGPALQVPFGVHWFPLVDGLANLRAGYDRVFALDVDQLITNPDISLEQIVSNNQGFHASRDWGNDAVDDYCFSLCGTVWHQDSKAIIRETLKLEPEWRNKPFPAQGPLRYIVALADASTEEDIHIHPRRTFNAVPDAIAPGNVPEPWQPGDFMAHLTMVPIERRVELARAFIEGIS